MKIEFMPPATPTDREAEMLTLLENNRRTALIFTRLEGEVLAVVRSADHDNNKRLFVWLAGTNGAYCNTGTGFRSEEESAKTLVRGEWAYQPDAVMKVRHGT